MANGVKGGGVLVALALLSGVASAQTPNPNYWRASMQLWFSPVSGETGATEPPTTVYGLIVKMCPNTYHNTSSAMLTLENGCVRMYLSLEDTDVLIQQLQAYKANPAAHQSGPGYIFARVEDTGTVPIANAPDAVSIRVIP